jgi:protein-tyrosine-phosphatase
MNRTRKQLLFLCANRTIRSQIAASLLMARTRGPWDVWSTPAWDEHHQHALAHEVLDEIGITLLSSPLTTEPACDHTFDEVVILCSGAAAT